MDPSIDPVTKFIADFLKGEPSVKRAVLFGSRARGDYHDKSDYDIALEFISQQNELSDFGRISETLRERAPTLCGLDFVRIHNELARDLQAVIQKDGITIHEKKYEKI